MALRAILRHANASHIHQGYLITIRFNIIIATTTEVFQLLSSLQVYQLRFCVNFASHARYMPHLPFPS